MEFGSPGPLATRSLNSGVGICLSQSQGSQSRSDLLCRKLALNEAFSTIACLLPCLASPGANCAADCTPRNAEIPRGPVQARLAGCIGMNRAFCPHDWPSRLRSYPLRRETFIGCQELVWWCNSLAWLANLSGLFWLCSCVAIARSAKSAWQPCLQLCGSTTDQL